MKELEDIFKKGFELDTGKFYLTVIEMLSKNQTYLISILKRQVELQEQINGKVGQELDESVKERLDELFSSIDDYSKQTYHRKIQDILK